MKFGFFDDAAKEYVITSPRTPYPWINYLGTESFFSLISNTAGGYHFYKDARMRRITRYRYNNVPVDVGGRYFYINDDGTVWNPGWSPVKTELDFYQCRHGMGYSIITGKKNELKAEVTFFVPQGYNGEIQKVVLKNEGTTPKSFTLFSFLEWCLWNAEDDSTNFQRNFNTGEVEVEGSTLFHKTEYKERRDHFAFYTVNTDKLFFGMRVYPVIDGNKAMEMLGDNEPSISNGYYVEFDSKLFDPMLYLDGREYLAFLLHEVGHIAYDIDSIYKVKNAIDVYFSKSGGNINLRSSAGFKELLAYGMKDAIMKAGSIFAKCGNDEIIADAFVVACGYGPDLETGMKKIVRGISYMAKDIDDRFIALTWVLRVGREFELFRLPAVKTLNKAIKFTGSKLEKRELQYAARIIATMEQPISEGAWDNLREKFSAKFLQYKRNGVRAIKDDVFELNLRLRTAEEVDELMSIIRSANSSIAILQDYLTEDIPDAEREDILAVLQDLYAIRQKASKDKQVNSRYSGYIQVTYPAI